MRQLTDDDLEEFAELAADALGDITDNIRQKVYDHLRESGAPEDEIEAARLDLDHALEARIQQRLAELTGSTIH